MKQLFLIAFFTVFAVNLSHSQELLWAVNTDTLGYQWAEAILIGEGNQAYVGGTGLEEMYLLHYDNHGNIEFAKAEMGSGNFEAMTLGDNGYIYEVGDRNNGQNKDAILHVFEADGTPVFTQSYDPYGRNDVFLDVYVDQNNNIYVCGSSYKTSTDQVALLAKYSPGGTPIWFQEYEVANHQCRFKSIHVTETGEVYGSGSKNYSSPGSMEFLLVKYDENGNFISDHTGTLSGYSECHPAFSLMDNEKNIYMGGYVTNWSSPHAGFLLKISNGVVVWSQIIPNGGISNELDGGAFGPEGNIICYGIIYDDNDYDGYYAQFSQGGGLLHENTYSGPSNLNDGISNICIKDEYIYLCGGTSGQGTGFDMFALKLNSDFEQMWELVYNSFTNDTEYANAIAVDLDNHVLLAGVTATQISYLGALAKFANPLGIDDLEGTEIHPIEVFPNPAESTINFHLDTKSKGARYIICNSSGQIVQSGYIIDSPEQHISLSSFHSGTYFLQILDGNKQYNAKFVKK